MKKMFALLLAALLCLSLVACGDQPVDEAQQNDSDDAKEPTLAEILCAGEWYYLGLRVPGGLVFAADGTTGNGGTWTLTDTTLDCVWGDGSTTCLELWQVDGTWFMTDGENITLYNSNTKPEAYALGYLTVQVATQAWEDHLEVACVDGTYRLQVREKYMRALFEDGNFVDIRYSQGERQNVQVRLSFDFDSYYIELEDPNEVPLEIHSATGVLSVLTDLM